MPESIIVSQHENCVMEPNKISEPKNDDLRRRNAGRIPSTPGESCSFLEGRSFVTAQLLWLMLLNSGRHVDLVNMTASKVSS